MKKRYQGAGLLFWRRSPAGTLEILLGLRSPSMNHAPRVWSSFGGARNPGEPPRNNAVREALEETAHGLGWNQLPPEFFHLPRRAVRRVWLPFTYRFDYWFAEVTSTPPLWPSLNWEHTEARWFALDALPEPLHPETKKLLKKLK